MFRGSLTGKKRNRRYRIFSTIPWNNHQESRAREVGVLYRTSHKDKGLRPLSGIISRTFSPEGSSRCMLISLPDETGPQPQALRDRPTC